MTPLLFPCLLAAAIFPAPAQELPAQELPALKWTNHDQQSLMRGAWWNANPPLLPPVDAAAAPSDPMPEPAANADSPAVDPIPEDFTDVNEYFLPDYIRTSTGLIDPQKLLAEVESNDVIELIKLIKPVRQHLRGRTESPPFRQCSHHRPPDIQEQGAQPAAPFPHGGY